MRVMLLTLLWLAFATALYADEPKRPNVLFIVCDDLNTHVAPAGYEWTQTPTLAALASESLTLRRAYCQYPVCGPSRASFLHGLYPESTGVLNNTADIRKTRPGSVSMPQYFKQHGYWTASVGKVFHSPRHEHGEAAWHEHLRFDNDELPTVAAARKKFEAQTGPTDRRGNRAKWKKLSKQIAAPLNAQTPPGHGRSGLRDEQHRDGKNARQVVDWLESKRFGDKPFFIALGIQKPHVPFLAPDKYFELYPKAKIQFRRERPDLWDNIPRDAISGRYKAFGFELGVENEPRRRDYMQAYHACVSFIDAQINLVLSSLKEQQLWDETIIVFTSDHGYHLGDHFLWGKVTLFDIGARVPFVIRVPNMTQPGAQSDAMVELIDVFPTLTECAGLPTPSSLQGESLMPVLRGNEKERKKQFVYSVVSRRDSLGHAIRNQAWRYAKWPNGEELYDLRKDPHELNNLAGSAKHVEQLKSLGTVLKQRQKEAASRRSPQLP